MSFGRRDFPGRSKSPWQHSELDWSMQTRAYGGSLMERTMALPVLSLCLVIFVGCGGNDNRTSKPLATSTDNWQLGGANSALPQLGGELALTKSTITGSMTIIDGSYDPGSCFTPLQLFSLSGTIDPQGNISGTASPGSVQETEPGYLHVSGTEIGRAH